MFDINTFLQFPLCPINGVFFGQPHEFSVNDLNFRSKNERMRFRDIAFIYNEV